MTRDHERAPLLRCLTVWAIATVGAMALGCAAATELGTARSAWSRGQLAAQPFDVLLVWLAALLATACLLWLWVVTTLVTLAAARGRRPRLTGCPRAVRRVLLAACGVALAGGLAAPAHAVPTPLRGDDTGGSALEGLPLPQRPAAPWGEAQRLAPPPAAPPVTEPAPPPTPGPSTPGPQSGRQPDRHPPIAMVVVRPGDTLWGIAAESLPQGAPAGAIDRRWRAIYDANTEDVGPDPDLILPTTTLRLPRRTR